MINCVPPNREEVCGMPAEYNVWYNAPESGGFNFGGGIGFSPYTYSCKEHLVGHLELPEVDKITVRKFMQKVRVEYDIVREHRDGGDRIIDEVKIRELRLE